MRGKEAREASSKERGGKWRKEREGRGTKQERRETGGRTENACGSGRKGVERARG